MARPHRSNLWNQSSRTHRKRAWIRLKNKITSHEGQLGGAYTTHDVVLESSWADIYFLSQAHRNDFYNATVDTALYAYFSECEERAREASEQIFPYLHRNKNEFFEKLPNGNFRIRDAPVSHVNAELRAFGGLTRYAWIDQEVSRLADSGDVVIFPCVKIDTSYCHGVGLLATLPLDVLSISDLDQFVRAFWKGGELAFVVDTLPLSYPSARRFESQSSNAIAVNPLDWVPADEAALALQKNIARTEHASLVESLEPHTAVACPLIPKSARL